MTDAISRSAVLEILNDEFNMAAEEREDAENEKDRAFNAGEIHCARRSTRKVNDLPALDVAPVVHARWIMNHFGAKCSNCLRLYCIEPSWSEKIKHMPPTWIYCPNCGARMDGDANGTDKEG